MKRSFSPILSTALVFALALSIPMASWAGACGGEGQRACCNGDAEFAHNPPFVLLPCEEGLFYSTSLNCTDPNGCSCSGRIITSEVSLGIVTGPLPAVARGNEPVATALANCPTIALPVTAAWCKFPAHVIQETRRLAFAADERKHQSPLFTIKHSIPFRGAA